LLAAIIPREKRLGKDDGRHGDADMTKMRWQAASVLLMGLGLTACEPSARPPPPYFVIPPGPAAPARSEAPAEDRLAVRPLLNQSNPEVQYFLPSHPGDVERGPTPVPQPGSTAGPFYTPPYSGPVTGYGPGGMAQLPGAPPNPPYGRGGLLGPR
jgi:hypothetical protein